MRLTSPGALIGVLALLCSRAPAESASPWATIVIGKQSEPEALATVDLQRYIAQVTGRVPRVVPSGMWRPGSTPALLIGTEAGNPRVGALPRNLGEQGYLLSNRVISGRRTIVAAGRTPSGAVNAIYGLLWELGFGFYLGSEAAPAALPDAPSFSTLVRRPAFAVRGVLPWYNFFDSPTTWDPIDHRSFIDQLVRSGANFIGFHSYDSEPFAAYPEKGRMVWGGRLLNTASPTWGTRAMPTGQFAGGASRLFADEAFGARTSLDIADPNQAIRAEQAVMRDALAYAHRRGLKTCIGFEMSGDPTNPADRAVFLKRVSHLLDAYPMLDYVWIWQSETVGASGYRAPPGGPTSALNRYAAARRGVFKRIVERKTGERPFFQDTPEGKAARAAEGARLEQFAWLAWRTLHHRSARTRLIVSGWGGDERILSAEYYEGLDKLLPKDVVFSSLDHIVPRDRVDRVYGQLPADRQRWPIPWIECDGDQWHAQPHVHTLEKLAADARRTGSQGLLTIHWRTRDVEEDFAYLMRSAWDPSLTAEAFFADLGVRCYGPEIGGEMGRIHSELDRLGYRWVGGAGQAECAAFTWGPGEAPRVAALQALRERAAALLPRAGAAAPRLNWLIASMDWTLRFQDAEVAALHAQGLIEQARRSTGDARRRLAREALDVLDGGALDRALQAYALRMTTRGEAGVLATINTKAVAAWRDLRTEAAQMTPAAATPQPEAPWKPAPGVLLPRLVASAPAGRPLDLEPIVLGGAPAWMHYRRVGSTRWQTEPLTVRRGWVQRGSIPAALMQPPGVEVGFSLAPTPSHHMAWGPVAVTVMPAPTAAGSAPSASAVRPGALTVHAGSGAQAPVEYRWNVFPQADWFRVVRGGSVLGETSAPFWPDAPRAARGSCTIEAVRDGVVVARSRPVAYRVADRAPAECPAVSVRANRSAVLLTWPPATSLWVGSYSVSRFLAGDGEVCAYVADVPASFSLSHVCRDTPPPGNWNYTVVPMSPWGSMGQFAVVGVSYSPADARPVALDLPLTARPDGFRQIGEVRYGPDGATFAGGYLVLPHRDMFNMSSGLTVAFEFRADDVQGMPVLISHGLWQADGWFVQILGGRLIIRTPTGDAEGPSIVPGRWYRVRWTFDGVRQALTVDGVSIPQATTQLRDIPAERNLVIGQYESVQPDFAFRGALRNVRILDDVEP